MIFFYDVSDDSMFSELMGMADSVQEEVDGAGEDFGVMSLLHRRSYNNVQRPAFRRNPNVPVITQPWTILRLTIIIIIRKIEIWDYFSSRPTSLFPTFPPRFRIPCVCYSFVFCFVFCFDCGLFVYCAGQQPRQVGACTIAWLGGCLPYCILTDMFHRPLCG